MFSRARLFKTCLALVMVAASGITAQNTPSSTVFERYSRPIEIYKTGLGSFTHPISSSNKEAQAFFDQGFQMMYAPSSSKTR